MQRLKSLGHAQRFLAAYGLLARHLRRRRHLTVPAYHQEMPQSFQM